MPRIADRVQETTATTGTGTLTLAGAVSAFQAFSAAFADRQEVEYAITSGTAWEEGYGTYSGATLTRNVRFSSNANALVSLTGTSTVFATASATFLNTLVPDYLLQNAGII